jgi:hypothetical protein
MERRKAVCEFEIFHRILFWVRFVQNSKSSQMQDSYVLEFSS